MAVQNFLKKLIDKLLKRKEVMMLAQQCKTKMGPQAAGGKPPLLPRPSVSDCGCFVAGTQIWRMDKTMSAIEGMAVGDIVYTYSDEERWERGLPHITVMAASTPSRLIHLWLTPREGARVDAILLR